MREILFRGKRFDSGEWVEGSLYLYGEDAWIDAEYDFPSTDPWVKVDPATVGQYTGLEDKNGKRIFDGDIVRVQNLLGEPLGDHVVHWDKTFSGWYTHHFRILYGETAADRYEILGNKWDNPELVEDEDGK